ncbi:thiamine biosynthesis protein ThiS [Spongiibacter sp. IMCC21906]|jgi:sulfur carrier protein|uniref:sulfur carrier protein ThiS n=1 Tax=Spongiibacter sp. IMCC21906 TaxID=1620392 RepID=UPI00062DDCA5|nr:sulfur carrier protein ThiS [Spongiibacter sp. IMCC21906]AKH68415.1 thiamine biosynthesis protein ThiS [Spongiibacter sp. IMCC21906]
MISVSVNNDAKQCDPQQPLTVLLAEWGFEREKIAVAVNGDFVPRSHYQQFTLSDGDNVDVLAPVQGG